MGEATEAEKLLVEIFECGRWEHSPLVDSVYIIPGELKDRLTVYLREHELIGV